MRIRPLLNAEAPHGSVEEPNPPCDSECAAAQGARLPAVCSGCPTHATFAGLGGGGEKGASLLCAGKEKHHGGLCHQEGWKLAFLAAWNGTKAVHFRACLQSEHTILWLSGFTERPPTHTHCAFSHADPGAAPSVGGRSDTCILSGRLPGSPGGGGGKSPL